jgi:glutamate dehydrogenase
LDWQQRSLTVVDIQMTSEYKTAEDKINAWLTENEAMLARWRQMVADFRSSSVHEFAKFSVALRELAILVQSCIRNASSMQESILFAHNSKDDSKPIKPKVGGKKKSAAK